MANRTLRGLAKAYEFETPTEAAEYIYESRVNGQHQQAARLFQGLDGANKQECIETLRGVVPETDLLNAVTHWLSYPRK